MKIRDIVVEVGPASYEKGKAKMGKLMDPTQWFDGTDVKQQYDIGKDKMNKLLSPSRWFEPTGTKAANPESQIKGYQTRQSLVQASQGSPIYANDTAVLKDLYSRLKSGNVKTNLELTQVLTAVKSAFNGVALNDEQKKLLGELSKQF
jgi:hypothetical protein